MDKLSAILQNVRKPARYSGGEYGSYIKDRDEVDLRFAFCFPDTYEIGMSHLGLRIIYEQLNSMEGVWCERCFAPWGDMEEALRQNSLPLYALESSDPLSAFDIVGFTLQYELSFTNVLLMLELGGIPLLSSDRDSLSPPVIAGGPCCCNPEPMADFIDLFFVGEAEEFLPAFAALFREAKKAGLSKDEFLKNAAALDGVYVPKFYEVTYLTDGRVASVTPKEGFPEKIERAVVKNLDTAFFPERFIVPSTEVIHDRAMLELFRGCKRGCRFCQAGHTTRPVRGRDAKTLARQGKALIAFTGCEEISLTSLSTSDFSGLETLCDELLAEFEGKRVNLSLPSLRADSFSVDLMERVQKVRKSGLTFAPEAGTQRLRDVINKNIREEDVLNACSMAFNAGWSTVKLYFMLGLPTETDEDIKGISEVARHVKYRWTTAENRGKRGVSISVSTSLFVPKPHTPFQWEPQDTIEESRRKVGALRDEMRIKGVSYNWHDAKMSHLEAIFARGDRRLGAVILEAYRRGCRFDGWDDQMKFDTWMEVMAQMGLDPAFYANRRRDFDETLPWDHIDMGVSKAFLQNGAEAALRGEVSPDCSKGCMNCGARRYDEGGSCFAGC